MGRISTLSISKVPPPCCLGVAGYSRTVLHPYNSVLSAREDFSLTRVFRGPVVKCTSLGEEVIINDARFVASDEISRLVVSLNAVFCLQAYKLAIMTFVMQISGTDDSRQDSLTRKNIVDPCKVLETLSSTLHLF